MIYILATGWTAKRCDERAAKRINRGIYFHIQNNWKSQTLELHAEVI